METRDMVRMANQISDFFKSYSDDYAKKEIATHINSFWDPRMRRMLFAHVAKGGDGLNDLVKAAMVNVRPPPPFGHPPPAELREGDSYS